MNGCCGRTAFSCSDPGSPGSVDSFNARTGIVVSVLGDYSTSLITNVSTAAGATCTAALDGHETRIDNLELADIALDGRVDTLETEMNAVELVQTKQASPIALWVAATSGANGRLIGFTQAQLDAGGALTPQCIVTITGAGACNGLSVLADGSVVGAFDGGFYVWDAAAQFWIPTQTFAAAGPGIRVLDGGVGAEASVFQFPTEEVFLLGATSGARAPLSVIHGGPAIGSAPVLTAVAGAATADTHIDGDGNAWVCIPSTDTVQRLTYATMLGPSGAGVVDKLASGSNFNDVRGIAADGTGGYWFSSDADEVLRFYNAAAITALTASTSNPAATRTLTITGGGGPRNIALDQAGNAWVALFDADDIAFFTAAQLAAGGAQAPTRLLDLTALATFAPHAVRAGKDFGLYRR